VNKILSKLGVPLDVQLFFEPYYCTEGTDLVFDFGGTKERWGKRGHQIPNAIHYWQAGNTILSFYWTQFKLDDLCFIAIGIWVRFEWTIAPYQKIGLIFKDNLVDVFVAATIKGKRPSITYLRNESYEFKVDGKRFELDRVSLNAFERASGLRLGVRTYTPKGFPTFLEQLIQS
jgi:hypothetical protein